MKTSKPATPKGRKTRIKLINAAAEALKKCGYVTLRMADVAAEAGLSTGALYRYFDNKEDLFASVIEDVHEELFESSRAIKTDFKNDPYGALLAANYGYLQHYYANRDVMRAFLEATTVDTRFREIWWKMRNRHVQRFTHALETVHGINKVNGLDNKPITEAMASMVEQSAYCWFALEEMNEKPITIEAAAKVVTKVWHNAFFS